MGIEFKSIERKEYLQKLVLKHFRLLRSARNSLSSFIRSSNIFLLNYFDLTVSSLYNKYFEAYLARKIETDNAIILSNLPEFALRVKFHRNAYKVAPTSFSDTGAGSLTPLLSPEVHPSKNTTPLLVL